MAEEAIIEKLFGKKITTEKLNIEGFNESLKFDIYDGYAVCKHGEDIFDMQYPQLSVIKESKELTDAIIDYCGCEKSQITVIQVLITFNTLYKNGIEITI